MGMMKHDFEKMKADFRGRFGTSFDFLKDHTIYESPLYKFLERMPREQTFMHTPTPCCLWLSRWNS